MKVYRSIVLVFVAILLVSVSAEAQRRPTRTTPKVVTSNTITPSASDTKSASEKVSIQIKNTTKFLYLLGGVAKGIEDLDKDRNANRAARDANTQNKSDLLRTIRNLRAGILALEVEFRTKAPLKRHLPLVQGITDLTAQCEDLAAAGRFSDSGKPLLLLVEKLSDALAAM
jgi:hypothetical protein